MKQLGLTNDQVKRYTNAHYTQYIPQRAERYMSTEKRIQTHLEMGNDIDALVNERNSASTGQKGMLNVTSIVVGLGLFLGFLFGIWVGLGIVSLGFYMYFSNSAKERERAYAEVVNTVWHLYLDQLDRELNVNRKES